MVDSLTKLVNMKRKCPEDILNLIKDEDDIILPTANGEPNVLLDVLEKNAYRYRNVKLHQMLALKERDYIQGNLKPSLSYVAYFLSGASRKAYQQGQCELVPNHFHEVPQILKESTKTSIVLTSASPMDKHGYFSLGTDASYVASLIGDAPFFLEVNKQMPRTFGGNQIHINQIEGFIEVDYPLVESIAPPITEVDEKIASYVAELIEDGSTIQCGIGAIPNAVLSKLINHKNLGVHTELLTDGIIDLVEAGVINGTEKKTNPRKIITTFSLGTKRLYDFINDNPDVEFHPVEYVNDPREIGKEDKMVSINATTEIDFYGQCASETVGGKYFSSSGGQVDFAVGVRYAKNGKGFICLHSTAKGGTVSRIKAILTEKSVVTTTKNDVDYIVTEYGVARLRGKSIAQRTEALIKIAHPKFREELTNEAKRLGFLK